MKTLSYLIPKGSMKVDGDLKGEVTFSGTAEDLGRAGMKDIDMKASVNSKKIRVALPGIPTVTMTDFKSDCDVTLPAYPISNYNGAEMIFDISAAMVTADSGKDGLIELAGLKVNVNVDDTVPLGNSPDGKFDINISSLHALSACTDFKASGIDMAVSGHLLTSPASGVSQFSVPESADGELILEKVAHTPVYLEYESGGMFQTFVSMMAMKGDIRIESGEFASTAYLYPVKFSGLNLTTDLDRYSINARMMETAASSFSLNAVVNGVKGFLTSYNPVLLKADADIVFNNVDINRLSWGYYGAQIKADNDSAYYIPPLKPFTASDSTCVLIPRNIEANIRLKSKSAEYMQYQFSPLQTEIILKDGNATLKRLTIGAPYCTVAVDWTYATRHADHIYMQLNAEVDNFNFDRFYKVFPEVVAKAKEIENFNGNLSAVVECRFGMFPTMFLDAPSLSARFDIRGTDMEFERSGKIEKLTHLMRIEGDEPIKLANIDITGAFHDNLLQINPFKIKFGGYQIGVAGANNMHGDIYYHLALEKSPFHLPFGVSLIGKMKHPEVRFGGTSLDDARGENLSMDLEWNPGVNIMASLKNGWQLFIQQAAKYQQKNESTDRP